MDERPSADLTPEQIWQRYDAMEARLSASLSDRMLQLARLRPGMRVLDMATGRGEPAVRAAHRVGPGGLVVGIDVAASMLAMAAARAKREGITNLVLIAADAAAPVDLPGPAFDAALCRWGLMYMDKPGQALLEARKRLAASGRLVLAVWAEPARVPWFALPRQVLARWREVPPVPLEGPGPCRYGSPDVLDADLVAQGFAVEHSEEMDVQVLEAESPEGLVAWVRAFGFDKLVRDLPAAAQSAWATELASQVLRLNEGRGYHLGGVTRLVAARPV